MLLSTSLLELAEKARCWPRCRQVALEVEGELGTYTCSYGARVSAFVGGIQKFMLRPCGADVSHKKFMHVGVHKLLLSACDRNVEATGKTKVYALKL